MAIIEEVLKLEDTSGGIVDFPPMAPNPNPPAIIPPARQTGTSPRLNRWGPVIVASILSALLALGVQSHFRSSDSAAKSADEHIGKLISNQLDPAVKDINANVDKQVGPLKDQLNVLAQQVGQLQGRFQQLDEGQKKLGTRMSQQESLGRLLDPNRVLATIRAEVQVAQQTNKLVQASDLADYKTALRTLSSSSENYWTTVAAVINYQSLLNQLSGEAPDPTKVARPCLDEHYRNNTFNGGGFRNCYVVLDTESFNNLTFQDSVVIYHGGPVALNGVRFINCRFVLELSAQPVNPPQSNLMLAILDSPDQKTIQVPK